MGLLAFRAVGWLRHTVYTVVMSYLAGRKPVAWCFRVTSLPWVPHGPATVDASAGALQPTCGGGPPVAPPPQGAPVTNGNIYASLVGGILTLSNIL